ncbi:hypothetical protein ZWY2020_022440 [Hordeum vulgare]|nr:hypothetical protein ZWY2020_022440 [Hordeum vulgare]
MPERSEYAAILEENAVNTEDAPLADYGYNDMDGRVHGGNEEGEEEELQEIGGEVFEASQSTTGSTFGCGRTDTALSNYPLERVSGASGAPSSSSRDETKAAQGSDKDRWQATGPPGIAGSFREGTGSGRGKERVPDPAGGRSRRRGWRGSLATVHGEKGFGVRGEEEGDLA